MDTDTPTNLESETVVVEEQEVETPEPELNAEGETPEGEEQEQAEEDEELDVNGEPIKLPKSIAEKIKPHLMMQADYTQKTQTVAEEKRAVQAERQSFEQEQQIRQQVFEDEARLLSTRERLAQFQNVNWQQAWLENPQQAGAWQAEYTQLRDYHDQLYGHVEGRKSELAQRREQETAIAASRAVEMLNKPDPDRGWDGKFDAPKRQALTDFGLKLGFTNEELSRTTHPRMIQTLNLAKLGYEALQKQTSALAKPRVEVKPVPQVGNSGKTKPAITNPDKLPMDQWLKWREAQVAKAGKR